MQKLEHILYRHLNRIRRTMQWLALLFIVFVPILNVWGFHEIIGTFYSLTIGSLNIVDPSLMLQTILLSEQVKFGLLLAGIIPLIMALFFGKTFCSWVCPFNLLAEYTAKLRVKIFRNQTRSVNINPKPQVYWFILGGIFLLIGVLGTPLISYFSFPGLISAQITDTILFATVGIEWSLIIAVLLIEFFYKPRFWCKYLCPVGAVLAIPRFKNSLSVQYESKRCSVQCSADKSESLCNTACPFELNPRKTDIYPYCFNCGACVYVCQNNGGHALKFTFHPEKPIHSNHKSLKQEELYKNEPSAQTTTNLQEV
ncbi:MAG: 4Fe-4S binding protein [Caldithrix sp.]|nr:4Fe-4S binding protein [Caldithrix sp.]